MATIIGYTQECPIAEGEHRVIHDSGFWRCVPHNEFAVKTPIVKPWKGRARDLCTHTGVKFLTVRLSCSGITTHVCPRCGQGVENG